MTNEDIIKYSTKYKKHQKKLSLFLMIAIIIISVILIGLGLFIAIYPNDKFLTFGGVVMIILGCFDIPMIITFNKKTQIRIDNMSNEEAVRRYCKIYGINYEEK